ncbi:AbrB/MazE/SpoVT family DNA-binding domain-containing protein [Methyloglobulus sp.]|uniref:AbrB/MazE/SpoVT family DNA-binding domain-containing protein n=1 Tax=Methyloglobulus sp. TaxID=2518622 RepID=UPI00398A24E8
MHVTSKGQVTIPQNVRENMGIQPAQTEIDFMQDDTGRWYIVKASSHKKEPATFALTLKW